MPRPILKSLVPPCRDLIGDSNGNKFEAIPPEIKIRLEYLPKMQGAGVTRESITCKTDDAV